MCGSIAITAGNVLCGFDGQTHPFLLSSHCHQPNIKTMAAGTNVQHLPFSI
jgi:hypothetical protein